MQMRQALRLSALAGLTLGAVHAADVVLLLGRGLPWSWRLASAPGIVGLVGCLALACTPLAWAALKLARRAPAGEADAAWVLSSGAAFAPVVWAAHRLYLYWASQTLDFPEEAAVGVAAAVAIVAGAALLAARFVLRPLAQRVVDRAGARLWPALAVAVAAPVYVVATRTLPAVHLDDRLLPYVLALIGLAFVGWAAAARPEEIEPKRLALICLVAPALALAQPAAGRKVVRRAAPLADAVSSLGLSLADLDGDGHASWLVGGTDCDDGTPAVQPGAPETPGDGVDNNCLAGDLAPADAANARRSLGVGASAPSPAPSGPEGPAPVMVVVTVDALRADRLHPATMPRTWEWAKTGTRFDRAYAAGSHTQSALPPLLTGQYLGRMIQPGPAGMRFAVGGTLAGLLAAHGWHTIALQTAGLPAPLLAGFAVREDLSDLGKDLKALTTTTLLVRELIAQLQDATSAAPARPVFAWLHTMDVHAPYRPSYDAQVAQTDTALGLLYDHLAQHHPAAVLAVSADHGEALGERGRQGHGRTLEDDQVLVPLVLAGRGIRPGHMVPGVVEVLDLTPTLVALAGLPPAPWMDGRSLLPLVTLPASPAERPGGQRAFMEVRGLGGSFLRGVATPYATVVRDLRRDLFWTRPPDAPDEAITQARTLLLAWEEGVLSAPAPPRPR